jgi:uncharacterized membrane protein
VSLEIDSYWHAQDRVVSRRPLLAGRGAWQVLEQHRVFAQFSYSAWFMVFGAVLLGAGFGRKSAFLRWQGLILLAVAVGKVFLVDMSTLSQGYRVLSFLGLGALLLAVSFVYQRDWLNLRAGTAAGRHGSGQEPQP